MSKSLFALTAMVVLFALGWGASRMFPHALDALNPPPPSAAAEYRTSGEKRSNLEFRDQTRIEMNVDTDLRVTELGAGRRIDLVHGEAWATVTRNAGRQTLFCTHGIVLRSDGGTFNVVDESNSTVITVVEGDVLVSTVCDENEQQGPLRRPAVAQSVRPDVRRLIGTRLVANDQLTIVTSAEGVTTRTRTLTPNQTYFMTSWRAGILKFDGIGLGDAIAQVNRNCHVHIELTGPEMAETQLGGSLDLRRRDSVSAFLKALTEIYGVVRAPADPSRPDVIRLVRGHGNVRKLQDITRNSTATRQSTV